MPRAHNTRILASSAEAIWRTPLDLVEMLDREFDFTLDTCASADNAIVPASYFGPDHYDPARRDALTADWRLGAMERGRCRAFLQPPYSRELKIPIEPFIETGHRWAREPNSNITVVGLLPAAVQTRWWSRFALDADEIRFFTHRLKFWLTDEELEQVNTRRAAEGKPAIGALTSSNVNHALVIWRPRIGRYVRPAPRISWWSHRT